MRADLGLAQTRILGARFFQRLGEIAAAAVDIAELERFRRAADGLQRRFGVRRERGDEPRARGADGVPGVNERLIERGDFAPVGPGRF